MSCIAVVNRDTPKKENKSSKSHMHHNPETADICWIVSFFFAPPSLSRRPTNCPWRPAVLAIKKKGGPNVKQKSCSRVCLCARDLSAEKSFWKQCRMKYKQRWKVWTPASSATIPHHNQYNLFNYFQYLHWCTQNTLEKWDPQPTPTWFPDAVKSSCTF